jgi:DNA-binding protein HU-beta
MHRKTANRADVASLVAKKAGVSQAQAGRLVTALLDAVGEALIAEGQVKIAGFGSFEVRDVAGSKGRHFQSGEIVDVPGGRKVRFVASAKVVDAVNEGLAADACDGGTVSAKRWSGKPAREPRTGLLVGVRLAQEEIDRLDRWRSEKPDLPTRTEAARRLLKAVLGTL